MEQGLKSADPLLKHEEGANPVSADQRVVLLFTGQSSQYGNMSRQLYDNHALYRYVFDDVIARIDRVLNLGASILDRLFTERPSERDPDAFSEDYFTSQLGLFAQEYATARLWMNYDLKPVAVIGQSLGEYAAACIAGVVDLNDAIDMLVARIRAMNTAPIGKMLAVVASVETVKQGIGVVQTSIGYDCLWISVVNGPASIVVSGTTQAIGQFKEWCASQRLLATQLPTDGAFHSPLFAGAAAVFRDAIARISPNLMAPSDMEFISTVGRWAGSSPGGDLATADYWVSHIVEPVNFYAACMTLVKVKPTIGLEVGPQPVLACMARANLCQLLQSVQWLYSFHRKKNDVETFRSSYDQLVTEKCVVGGAF